MKYLSNSFLLLIVFALASCNKPSVEPVKESQPVFDTKLTEAEIAGGKLTPEILWKFGRLGEFQLSPDAKSVILTLTYYDIPTNAKKSNIYKLSIVSGELIALTNNTGSQFNIRWIENGNKIAYLSTITGESQLWQMNIDGSIPVQISSIDGGINSFEYSPDGSHLIYTKDVKEEETPVDKYPDLPLSDVRIIDNLMYRHWNSWNDYMYSHIFVAGISNNAIIDAKDIMEGEKWDAPLSPNFDNTEMSWSQDGKIIAYTCKKLIGKEYAVSTNSDIYLYNLETGKTENITEGMMGYDKYPVFSPNDEYIAFQSMKTPGFESDKPRLMVYNVQTKEKVDISENFDQDASGYIWKNDKEIYFISGINATYQIYKVDLEKKLFTQVTNGYHDYQTINIIDTMLVGMKMSMAMASELFQVNTETGNEKQLTNINKNIYDNIEMGKFEEHWIPTFDGKKMLVWIIYPPKFDPEKKYPALLYCQGGPQTAVSQSFSYRWNFQMMAANDYIIIAPNRRGLPTFGQEWNDQISGDYYGKNIQDYLSSVDYFKKEKFIDENRIGAVGASYGGYSVYYLAGNHEGRFKAFLSHCGIYDFESMYTSTEETFFVNHDLTGPYWDKNNKLAQASYAHSPHKFVANWDTPIMIVTGGNDFRIPYTQSMEAFNAAQLRGIPSKLLFFPNEYHFVIKPQNSILWQREFFAWFDKWLK